MSDVKVTVKFDEARLKARFAKGASMAQKWLDNDVARDTDQYVPMQSGTLRLSIKNSVYGSGRLSYQTPYARAQYYGKPNKSKVHHPWATMKWLEASKRANLSKWVRQVKVMFALGMG